MAFSELWSHRGCEEEKDIIEKVNPTFRIVGNYLTGKKTSPIPNISYMDYNTQSFFHFYLSYAFFFIIDIIKIKPRHFLF